MNDNRKFDRYEINIPVRALIDKPGGVSEKIEIEAINLSARGMLIKKGISLPDSSPIKFEIMFHFEDLKTSENPDGDLMMTVTGHVMRTEDEGIVIRFNDDYEMSQCLSFLKKRNKS